MTAVALDRYVRHAERFGTELVFETAVGLGAPRAELTVIELVALARRLQAIDPRWNPTRPDQLVERSGAVFRDAYLDRIVPVLDACAAPRPTSASRRCEWCGRAVAGRADRRTCSPACRKRLNRASDVGPFSRPEVTPTGGGDLRVGPGRPVTRTPRQQKRFEGENRGGGDFQEVAAR